MVGLPAVRRALARAREIGTGGPALMTGIADEVHAALMTVEQRAVQKAPVQWGILRGSGEAPPPLVSHDGIEGRVTFGGLAADYASVQHEHEEFVHPKGGQAHFLFGAADAAWEESLPAVMDELDRAVEERAEEYIGGTD